MMTLGALIMPVLMVIGFIAVWRMPKRDRHTGKEDGWRDTSLDDWRAQRDAEIERERQARLAQGGEEALRSGATGEDAEPVRHQRIGG